MNAYAVMSLVALIVNVTVGLYVLSRAPRTTLNRLFFAVMMCLAAWSAGELIQRLSHSAAAAMRGERVAAFGWCLVGAFFVLMVLELTDHQASVRKPLVLAACFVPGLFFIAMIESSRLVFKGFTKIYWGWEEIQGAWRFPSKIYVVAMFLVGLVILFSYWRTATSRHKKAGAAYLLLAALVPVTAGVVTDMFLPLAGIHFVPLPMMTSTIIAPVIGYAVLTVGLMTTTAGTLGSTIITKMNDAVLVSDAEGMVETINPAASRLTGYPEHELVGTPLGDLFIESAHHDGHPGEPRLPEESETMSWSLCATRDGEIIPVTRSAGEVRRKGGRLLGSVTVVRDMRETLRLMRAEHEVKVVTAEVEAERDHSELLKHSEEEMRKLSRFLESVIENVGESLFIQDVKGRYVYVNEAHRRLTGYDKDEILGKTDYELYWHEYADTLRDRISKVFEGGVGGESPELTVIDRDGAQHVTRTTTTPMKNEEGDVEFVVGIIKDLTEQKKLEGARLDFIRIAAHELRTPLTSLKLGLDMLARETRGALNGEQQRSLDVLSLSIERLSRLSKNLLDLASMDAGLLTLHMQEVEIGTLFAEAKAMFLSAVREKGLEMTYEVPAGTRPALADPSRLSQVLYNLVSNAVKYTDSGSITMRASDPGDGMIEITVTDTGAGIPSSQREAIFARFVKAQSAETAREGTGLGLSITKAIVEAHGGTISVESKVGSGSTFRFRVPAASRMRGVTVSSPAD